MKVKLHIFVLLLPLALTGCGISQEEYDAAVNKAEEYQNKYEQSVAEIETYKEANDNLTTEIAEYEQYAVVINALKNDDYDGAIASIVEMKPHESAKSSDDIVPSESTISSETEEKSLSDYAGTWFSKENSEIQFVLNSDGSASIGNVSGTWAYESNNYGAYGICIYVDNGAGFYQFLFGDKDSLLVGNGATSNMPEYIPWNSFGGKTFIKTN